MPLGLVLWFPRCVTFIFGSGSSFSSYEGSGGCHHFFHGLWNMFVEALCQFRVVNAPFMRPVSTLNRFMKSSMVSPSLCLILWISTGSLTYFFCCIKYAKKTALRSLYPSMLSGGSSLNHTLADEQVLPYDSSMPRELSLLRGRSLLGEESLQPSMDFFSLVTVNLIHNDRQDILLMLLTEVKDVNPGYGIRFLRRLFFGCSFRDSGHNGVVLAIALIFLRVIPSVGFYGWRQLVDTKVRSGLV
ncbi:hypothetical protein Tco_0465079 [Tanacetum coccineum]